MIWTKITLKVTSCIDAICIYAELKCFTAHIVLNGETRYLASIDELGMAGVIAHRKLGVLICLGCNSCCLPNNMAGHVKQQHGVKIQDSHSFFQECKQHRIHFERKDIQLPAPWGPPVECIAIHDGLACNSDPASCMHCCKSIRTMEKHIHLIHPIRQSSLGQSYRENIKVQTLFSNFGQCFFEVLPALADIPSTNVITHILCDYLPSLPPPAVTSPNTDCEVTPFLKVMGWVDHMKEFQESPDKHSPIKDLKSVPRTNDLVFQNLLATCQQYIRMAITLGRNVGKNLMVRKHLVQGRTLSNGPL